MRQTAIHELRHAYQYEAIEVRGSSIVKGVTRRVWKENLDNYISPDPNNMNPYLQQPVEWDAKGFARQRLEGLAAVYEGSWEDE